MTALLPGLLRGAADLIWPLRCPRCGADGQWCPMCRPDVGSGGRVVLLADGTPVAAAAPYRPDLAPVVRAWKLSGRRGLTSLLADHLAEAVAHLLAPAGPTVWVPVPVRASSRRRRGADLVGDLARAAARQIDGAEVVDCLAWRRRVGEQVGADGPGRLRNVAGAMTAQPPPGGAVIVVDDVLTTGSTLSEAVRALRSAGAQCVAGAVLAGAGESRGDG